MGKSGLVKFFIILGILLIIFTIVILSTSTFESDNPPGNKLALIEINGTITDSSKIIEEIQRYKDDKSVKAIVLRIDTPGGVVAPVQEIYEELNKVDKKIIASMGSSATSGGYYIACTADRIFANPGTLTGSIGVRMNFPRIVELSKKVGIDSETIKSGQYKDSGSAYRYFTPEEKKLFQDMVDDVYNQFVDAVYNGRKHTNLTKAQIIKIADGRVMSGRQAFQYKLVDELGNLEDAIQYAAKIGGIEGKPKIARKKPRTTLFERLMGQSFGNKISDIIKDQVSIRYEIPF
ncbi:MAG: signal peptide peptidase SppA [Candidatus Poribacteria bacterium]